MGSELGVTAASKPKPNVDSVGIWWACWCSIWTFAVMCGMAYLYSKRHLPLMRIRGLGLSLVAITLLHLYWISVQLGYIVGALAPGDAEYWIMGTYFPFGIALFHASNTRFLHVAKAQKKFASQKNAGLRPRGKGFVATFKRMDYTSKMIIVVGLGMLFQLFLTIFMYLVSRKFHRSWGIPGTEVNGTDMEQKMAMGSGWEWWPTCFWQFFWAWIVAPIILWKSRNVNDTHGWRVQTIGCAIANLHATPMWLIALYVPAMQTVNKYFIPPQWIAVSIFFMEIFTIFLPCWEVRRHQTLRQETLDSIAQWESKNKSAGGSAKSLNSSGSTMVDSIVTGKKSMASVGSDASNESILTMSALEHVLERNPAPLQEYSALRDFSGENIAFLTSVGEWKNTLPAAARNVDKPTEDPQTRELVRERFNRALRIYAQFVSTRDAEFPINISSADLKKLAAVFEGPTRILYGEKRQADSATPFDAPEWNKSSSQTSSQSTEKGMTETTTGCIEDRVQYWGDVPDSFNETIFDDAERSIKYLVLTNTWPKFVRDRRTSLDSGDAENGDVVKVARDKHSKL